jgi:hypothetical integral membrane protein (TIGR02206 family)
VGVSGPGWLHHFEAGTAFHGIVVGLCVLLMAVACVAGGVLARRDRTDAGARERAFGAAIGWTIVGWQGFATMWRVLPGRWDLNESLPFHLCRWTGWIAAVCLIAGPRWGWRWSRALMFFWGLGLSMEFWLYWVGHLQIVGVAVYDLAVRRFVPTARDLLFAAAAGVLFVALVMGVNHGLGTNYSYLGAWDYGRASVVDRLGPYPERVFKMAGGALVLFVLMYGAARGLAALGRGTTERNGVQA